MLNQNHSTALDTKEKINSIVAETMTEKRQSFLELSRGNDHLLLYGGKALSNAASGVPGLLSCKAALLAQDQLVLY